MSEEKNDDADTAIDEFYSKREQWEAENPLRGQNDTNPLQPKQAETESTQRRRVRVEPVGEVSRGQT